MLLSEEGEIHEESIIQISENSINKRNPVKIKKDKNFVMMVGLMSSFSIKD